MKEYKLTLKPEDVSLVGQALASLPYGQVAALIANIQRQVNDQEQELKAGEK